MALTALDYQKLTETLAYSQANFDQVDFLLGLGNANASPALDNLRQRWLKVLNDGLNLAQWVNSHPRAQSGEVYHALSELAKYSDVRRVFRLSVIGQKGVGKSALVNALLGASSATSGGGNAYQYTPSDVSGKALSGTRLRLISKTSPEQSVWKVVFLTPRRLWEIGSYLLTVARLAVPRTPANLDDAAIVLATLKGSLAAPTQAATGVAITPNQIQTENARQTLLDILTVYEANREVIPPGYTLELADPNLDGEISSYLTQTEARLHLLVDWIERYLLHEEAGFLAGRPIELEDVLGLDDPRDSFYALEAFREAFAVVMVFKCDRGLNTETSSILRSLFSRSEEELARFGLTTDLEKALVVANRFDEVLGNIAPDGSGTASPLRGIEDIKAELARYTSRTLDELPIYLTSANLALTAQLILRNNSGGTDSGGSKSQTAHQTANYNSYLLGLANLLELVTEQSNRKGKPLPDYLDFIQAKSSAIKTALGEPAHSQTRASLTLELSGLPRLGTRIEEALESGSIIRGRVANAEYYYARLVSETALCYARHLLYYKLDISEFSRPAITQESRLFSRFQHENKTLLENLDKEFRNQWFDLARRYIYGAHSGEITGVKDTFLQTISEVIFQNQKLIQIEPHIASGQLVTDAWRKVFEDINDWLALEAGRQMRSLVAPLLSEIEQIVGELQKQLTQKVGLPLEESFWQNYRSRLDKLRERLQAQAEILALGFYTDNRFSVYDENIAKILHVGSESQRRTEISQALGDRVRGWFNELWQLIAKVAMTDLNAFVSEVRYYVLGLPAESSLAVGLELRKPGSSELAPADSLLEVLKHKYYTDEAFRKQYARREPSASERVALEIRDWVEQVVSPNGALVELIQAMAVTQARLGENNEAAPASSWPDVPVENSTQPAAGQGEATTNEPPPPPPATAVPFTGSVGQAVREEVMASSNAGVAGISLYHRLEVPIQSIHPYNPITRQVWEVTQPNPNARSIRLHFTRIELGTTDTEQARIVIEAWGGGKILTITGNHTDYWTETLPARAVKIRFITNQAKPGWGFLVDGVSE